MGKGQLGPHTPTHPPSGVRAPTCVCSRTRILPGPPQATQETHITLSKVSFSIGQGESRQVGLHGDGLSLTFVPAALTSPNLQA